MLRKISRDVTRFIEESSLFQDWPQCRDLLMNVLVTDEPWVHALPVLTCKAIGGVECNAIPVAAAWVTLVHAANLIDDIQDGDLYPSASLNDPRLAMTVALSWIFTAFRLLDSPLLHPDVRDRITRLFASAGFNSSLGQYQDLDLNEKKLNSVDPLYAYWNTVILKSGSICMAGAAAGAAVNLNSTALIETLGDYGTALGVIKQVIDDCRDIWIDTRTPMKSRTLPMLLHSMVIDQRFIKSRNQKDNDKYSEAQLLSKTTQLMVEAGIPEIIADILFEWRRRAFESLHVLKPSKARDELEDIVNDIVTLRKNIT
jgi:geranylgeranyl pyrophosphate synthase